MLQLRADLDELPSGTSRRLIAKLEEGRETLERQAAAECQQETVTTTIPTTTETVPTVPTVPTTPPTTSTTTPPTVPTTPPTTPTTPVQTTPQDNGGVTTP
jgi:hypothetical protein